MSSLAPSRPSLFSASALAAGVVALALNGAWWYFLARPWSPAVPLAPVAESPRMTYLPGLAREARALGSPVLFALPSAAGFSGGLRVPPVPQALRVTGGEPVLLARSSVPASAGHYLPELGQLVTGTNRAPAWRPGADRVFTALAGSTSFAVRVYWPDGAPVVRSGLPGAGVLAPVLQDRPWELGALLEFDGQGGVQHVFIEKPTTSRERNDTLVRALRAIRIDNGGQPTRSRVVVQYEQEAGARPPAGAAAKP